MRIREIRVVFLCSSDFAAASSMMGSDPQESNETCGRPSWSIACAPRSDAQAKPARSSRRGSDRDGLAAQAQTLDEGAVTLNVD